MGKAAVMGRSCVWLAQDRSKRGRSSLCELRRGRQVRVHQDERPEGSVGSVVIDGRRRGPAAPCRRSARAGSRGAGQCRSVEPTRPCSHAHLSPFPNPPHTSRPGGARVVPRGDGGSCDGACRNEGTCGDEEASGGGQGRDDARELSRPARWQPRRSPLVSAR